MDELTYNLLLLIKDRSSLSLRNMSIILKSDASSLCVPIEYLLSIGYIERNNIDVIDSDQDLTLDTSFKITYKGIIAASKYKKDIRNYIFSEFRAWVTLAIAILAFIKSFFF